MPTFRQLTALSIARAMLAGAHERAGLVARIGTCFGESADWHGGLAERCARIPGEQWQRLTTRTLAAWIERDTFFRSAFEDRRIPSVRRYLLRPQGRMLPAPLGLDTSRRPHWPDVTALAAWLEITPAGLWRLTKPAAWQRRSSLGDQHYRCSMRAKRSGGWRLLEVPHPYLMATQRRVLDALLAHLPPHEAACGYARGRGLLDHVHAHVGQPVVLKFDLADFFSSVRASRVHALFATLGYPPPVARALAALCTTATPEPVLVRLREEGRVEWRQAQRLRDPHLPQGAPTSPALANLCAFRLDLRLDGLARTLGARYTRYADDIVLSGGRHLRDVRERVETWVGRIAREEGFALNHRKTRCQTAGRRQSVCNVVVNRTANLPRESFDRLKAVLHRCALDGPSAHNREHHPQWREHLEGRVAWAARLNPGRGERLARLLARIDWQR